MATAQDSAWKDILDQLFPEFLEFFFPEIHRDIDWSRGEELLDKELQPLLLDAEIGGQVVDKLVKVYLLDGPEVWILVHIEVQGQKEVGFTERMFRYNARIGLRFGCDVVSLAVLTDPSRTFRPEPYRWARWGCEKSFQFPVLKLIDYQGRIEELKGSRSPFSIIVLIHLEAMKRRSEEERLQVKFGLTRALLMKGFRRKEVIALLRFLDWLIRLPKGIQEEYHERIKNDVEVRKIMPYLMDIERIAIEKGRKEGRKEGREEGREIGREEGRREGLIQALTLGLRLRFGEEGLKLLPQVQKIASLALLSDLVEILLLESSKQDFERQLHRTVGGEEPRS